MLAFQGPPISKAKSTPSANSKKQTSQDNLLKKAKTILRSL
jgi:hypothetical protein